MLTIDEMLMILADTFEMEGEEMTAFRAAMKEGYEAAAREFDSIMSYFDDEEPDYDIEEGFDPYEGCYSFDC